MAAPPRTRAIVVDGQLITVVAEVGKPQPALLIPQHAPQIDQAGPSVLAVEDAN